MTHTHTKKNVKRALFFTQNLQFKIPQIYLLIFHKPVVPLVFSVLDSHLFIRSSQESSHFLYFASFSIYLALLFLFQLLNNLIYLFTCSLFLLPLFEFKFLLFFLGLLYLVSYPSNPFYIFLDLIILPPSLKLFSGFLFSYRIKPTLLSIDLESPL